MFKKSFDVITIGGVVRDLSFWSKAGRFFNTPQDLTAQKYLAFEYGAKVGIDEAFITFGGGASNSATTFAKLGLKTAVLTRVGDDTDGESIIDNLSQNKVNTSLVQKDKQKPSGFSFILSTDKKERDHVVFAFRGASENIEIDHNTLKGISSQWFYITSLRGEGWKKLLTNAFSIAREKRIKIAWNPGSTQLQAGKKVLEKLIKQTEVLILNKDEAIELALSGLSFGRKTPTHLNKPLYLLNILKDWGPKIVVITDGKKGAYAYEGKKIIKVLPLNRKVVDTTGVGDAFGSGFITSLIYKPGDIKEALRWANLNSNTVVTQPGAQGGILTKNQMHTLLKKTKIILR
ncbi:carbohydrate kinase family protein [Patescibacteria group bacterium]|nr:carbohydrate kinase family protein [Patescibacteria group bacterium]